MNGVSTLDGIDINDGFQRALGLLQAGRSVFITGKAGVGKSTLLTVFRQQRGDKPLLVVAPTGVAALNVTGSTIHRFFGFPHGVTPDYVNGPEYHPRNRAVIQQLDTLVIDEVSMVRADLMDCIDAALRRYGPDRTHPFGGVQMVFIGDLYQLPPVLTDGEMEYITSTYSHPYFFAANSLKGFDYDLIELTKVYRQSDDVFISILNAIRSGTVTQTHLDTLNERFDKGFIPDPGSFYVTLTTTNRKADSINQRRLDGLNTAPATFRAHVTGDVHTSELPAAQELTVKVGAQVMLLTNDPSNRWVNGTLGVVTAVPGPGQREEVTVENADTGEQMTITAHRWDITRPTYSGGRLTQEVVGSFTQLPIRLAWAVTIHKAQGKTLDRAILDMDRGAFADGQTYVGLSRVRSLNGLVLHSLIKPHHIKVDREVTRFLQRRTLPTDSSPHLRKYACISVLSTGHDTSDKVMEIAVVAVDGTTVVGEFTTTVNPQRDMGAEARHGLTPSMVSTAATITQLWPLLSRQLNGRVLVADGLPATCRDLERDIMPHYPDIDLGLGINVGDFLGHGRLTDMAAVHDIPLPEDATPLDRARAIARLLPVVDRDTVAVRPATADSDTDTMGWLTTRNSSDTPSPWATDTTPILAYSDLVAFTIAGDLPPATTAHYLHTEAHRLTVPPDTAATIHARFCHAVLEAAMRDGTIDTNEHDRLTRIHNALNVPLPDTLTATLTMSDAPLAPGMKVCFTGSATDLDGEPIDRNDLEDLAVERGLIPVNSVTKKNCDAVVAEDAASMSGKARKARQYGYPVISVGQFLTWANH